jgi:DoxX-like family
MLIITSPTRTSARNAFSPLSITLSSSLARLPRCEAGGIGKIRPDPRMVQVIHEVVGVPLKYFSLLAACEFAGALGVVLGIWWLRLGVVAGIGLVLYFAGALVSHLRVGDVKGIGPGAFMLMVAAGALGMRILIYKSGTPS